MQATGEIVTYVVYHSSAWDTLVEVGWTTDRVLELPEGEGKLARMVWAKEGRPPRS